MRINSQTVICDALGDLVPFAQFVENAHGGVLLLVNLQVHATLLKVTLLHGRLSRFLNCTNNTKSRKASHKF